VLPFSFLKSMRGSADELDRGQALLFVEGAGHHRAETSDQQEAGHPL
jgi:hypothetical protein